MFTREFVGVSHHVLSYETNRAFQQQKGPRHTRLRTPARCAGMRADPFNFLEERFDRQPCGSYSKLPPHFQPSDGRVIFTMRMR